MTRSHGQVVAPGRWTSMWIALPVNGYLIRNAQAANHTVEPNLWANVDVSFRIQCTTDVRTRARGSLHTQLVERHYPP